ncbi:50S ribosomal protein L16 3-hydroxylase [Fluviicoccus keumensis]|uniref:50S ribosomal protein L16 3-hydroxylase n=1 Tax=Fluviicoccus keumensis TaxID=1435465 RepID=A0A4Q7Z5U0_9GAMM|nr:cupin domain-containing protein [Fluviicoccus keumensis]RZU45221.1 50S ribosomal protein L16 3-hydroxylase [Fluviicoccus keumensis]
MTPRLPLAHLGGLTADEFLRDYWQKKPLLVRNAFPDIPALVGRDDLIELSQEEGIEARLVLEKGGKSPWELRKGPFSPRQFKQLPKTHWTLLVQAVDHYLPELAAYWDAFRFIPGWRTDDIMISYAPEGGSVGPHYDQYDVFLVQGAGQRRWQLGAQCDQHSPRLDGTPLRILRDMPVTFDETVNPGDLLYVPPGLAHYGVSQNECLTFSFGFRAPVLSHVLEQLVDAALEAAGSDRLYADPGLQPQANPGWINPAHLQALKTQVLELLRDHTRLDTVLAPFLSEPKYPDYEPVGEAISPDELLDVLQAGALICRDPASRMLYLGEAGHADRLFINGEAVEDLPDGRFVALLVDHRQLDEAHLRDWLAETNNLTWLCEQIEQGYWLILGEGEEEYDE